MHDTDSYPRLVLFWFVAALLLIQGLGGALVVSREAGIFLDQAKQGSARELDLIEKLVREPLLKHDYVTVVEFLRRWALDDPEIVHLRALAENDFVLVDHGTPSTDRASLKASRRVIHENRVLITLHIERNLAETRDQLAALRWQLGLGGFLLTLALGWTLWRILARLGLRPLQHEIGRRLAVENELRVHRNLLDEEVRQRTIELERTVQALQASEGALTQKSADLEATNLELQQLIHVIAHDLKGPLRAVSHLTTALEDECRHNLSQDALALLSTLRKRVQRMHSLIEALLAFSRAGRAGVVGQVDANVLVRDVIESFSVPAGFTFTVEPLPTLRTDTLHLRQVFANLIDNAIKHHDRRDGHVRISARDLGDGGYEFAVTDDGPGIPEQYRDQVFELFQTLQARDRQEHTGMGLTLVRKIVANRGGAVAIETRTPRGTTVRFTWPAEAAMANNGPPCLSS